MSIFRKPVVGHVQGKSAKIDDLSLRDQIVDGEGGSLDPETQTEPQEPREPKKPSRPPGEMEKLLRNFQTKPDQGELDRREPINYFGALDDIIADLYEKQGAAYLVVKAILQQFEQNGQDVPFEEERFNRICGNLSIVQASKEIAWLYGLGPEHADRVADLMIDKLFGKNPVAPKKE